MSYTVSDSATMTRRNLRRLLLRYRSMTVLLVGMPIVILILFVYIFGGQLSHGLGGSLAGGRVGRAGYLNYVTPGILLLAVAAAVQGTDIVVAMDMTGGIIDRFRTMPTGLHQFAQYQPFTPVTDTPRGLLTETPIGANAIGAVAWSVVLALVAYLWAIRLYRNPKQRSQRDMGPPDWVSDETGAGFRHSAIDVGRLNPGDGGQSDSVERCPLPCPAVKKCRPRPAHRSPAVPAVPAVPRRPAALWAPRPGGGSIPPFTPAGAGWPNTAPPVRATPRPGGSEASARGAVWPFRPGRSSVSSGSPSGPTPWSGPM